METEKNAEVLKLIQNHHEGALATLEEGRPFTSALNYFWLPGSDFGRVIFLMSDLARHAKNAKKNNQASLLVLESGTLPVYERKRVSIQGALSLIQESSAFETFKVKYLELFPGSKKFFELADFRFYEMNISELYYVGGFGKIHSFK